MDCVRIIESSAFDIWGLFIFHSLRHSKLFYKHIFLKGQTGEGVGIEVNEVLDGDEHGMASARLNGRVGSANGGDEEKK